ncbi:hypothetical protein D3C84_51670 [compost metagenome]
MSNVETFNFASLDSLLGNFATRPNALERDARLQEVMQACLDARLAELPLPGGGETLARWRALAQVAGADLALAKLYEGHTDAKAILAELASVDLDRPGIWGVWAAETPAARVQISPSGSSQVLLNGRKDWCSGALQIDHALLTAWDAQGQPQLVAITLEQPEVQVQVRGWQAVGMGPTASVSVQLDDAIGYRVGEPGDYLSRPGFWHGGAGIAACWYGAARALADYLRETCRKPREDQHADAHLGAVDAALYGAACALRHCADWIDRHPRDSAEYPVRRLRAQVEAAVSEVQSHVSRALGATPFCQSAPFARLSSDLQVFIRQSHAERDLTELGRQAATPAGGWQL